jgi:hypothetical protein
MAAERAQYPTICCIFFWEEFLRLSSIFAKLFLRFEYLNALSRSFDKADEIDVLLEDGLGETTLLNENSSGLRN